MSEITLPDEKGIAAIRYALAEMDAEWEAAKAAVLSKDRSGAFHREHLAAQWLKIFRGDEVCRAVIAGLPMLDYLDEAAKAGHELPPEVQTYRNERMVERIGHQLFGPGVDSHNRCYKMLRLIWKENTAVFWPVFLDTWSMCDDTWQWRDDLHAIMMRHGSFLPYAEEAARAFYDSLPDEFTVYRGCSRRRARGMSWTLDRKVAEGFGRGHRFIRVPDPVIAEARIPKSAVLAVAVDRKESEVLIDFAALPKRLKLVPIEGGAQ